MNSTSGKLLSVTAHIFRNMPRFRGKGRAALLLRYLFTEMGADPIVYCKMAAGHQLRLDCRVQSHCHAFFSGEYDDTVVSKILSFLRPGGAALDVGANIGFYTVPMARLAKSIGAQVVAVEPAPANYQWLTTNLVLNGCENVVNVWRHGLSDSVRQAELVLAEDFLEGGVVGNAIIADLAHYGPQYERVTVQLKPLDDVWRSIGRRLDIIKLDIEGHESEFLKGATETMKLYRPAILMEVNRYHHQRKGLDFDSLIPCLLPPNYNCSRVTQDGVRRIPQLADCPDGEDILLLPMERTQVCEEAPNVESRSTS